MKNLAGVHAAVVHWHQQRSAAALHGFARIARGALRDAFVCFAWHANNVGGALVPRPGFILHQATKAKGPSLTLFGLRCLHPIREVFQRVLSRLDFVRCNS